ncbi:hypothetical protein Q4Q39_20230 [Flavivirga amylovorans]|uniref:Alpha-L-fucosidase n=1 Tax=Flavivirga amylovorans TaxID=870486 RepID=A0ABT8X7R9_9FLAO|nr:hypothetical protein [Flavivirga amylovorans]MDO5989738.1 hypothetical protein [Flavivirga amylovorans]
MSYSYKLVLLVIVTCFLYNCDSRNKQTIAKKEINWAECLKQNDMLWNSIPQNWKEAPHLGNATIGSMLYQEGKAIKLHLFHANANDHRDNTFGWTAYSRTRFEIGSLNLNTVGDILDGQWRLDIWNAELNGIVKTNLGEIRFRHYVHAEDMVVVTEVWTSKGESKANWSWHPEKAETERGGYPKKPEEIKKFAKTYGEHYVNTLKVFEPNPEGIQKREEDIELWEQNLSYGGQYTTAWTATEDDDEKRTLYVSIASTYPENTATADAVSSVLNAKKSNAKDLIDSHRKWWHNYYPQSFVSIPDAALQKLYWNQIYRYGATARQGRSIVNTSGLWFQGGQWPYITNDYNTQTSHWALPAANRLEQSGELLDALHRAQETLIKNVRPVEWQDDTAFLALSTAPDMVGSRDQDMRYWNLVGCLPWALHNCWWQYKYSMDKNMLREKLFPLLRRSINLYFKMLEEREDGRLGLPPTYNPETGTHQNNNFDLGLFRWGCMALLESCETLEIDDPLIPKWKAVLEKLVDYPKDEYGFRLGTDASSPTNHRHGSHLLMIYPFYLVNIDQPNTKEVLNASVERFFSTPGLPAMVMTHAVPLAAAIGRSDLALEGLKKQAGDLHPNGLWHSPPCIEASLSFANGLQTMLIQDWENTIRVFPSVPNEWKNVSFQSLRTQGAFLIDATREDGKTTSIGIKSLAGEPCYLKSDIVNPIIIKGQAEMKALGKGLWELKLKKNDEILLVSKEN